jgi:hypothetical protein
MPTTHHPWPSSSSSSSSFTVVVIVVGGCFGPPSNVCQEICICRLPHKHLDLIVVVVVAMHFEKTKQQHPFRSGLKVLTKRKKEVKVVLCV